MSAGSVFFHTFAATVQKPDTPTGLGPDGKSCVGVGSHGRNILLTLIADDGSCLVAALDAEGWNNLMTRAAEQIEGIGGKIIDVPRQSRGRLN